MTTPYAFQPLGAITPFLALAAFALPLFSLVIKSKRFYDVYALVCSAIAFVASLLVLVEVKEKGPIVYAFGGWPPPIGIAYEADPFNAVLGVLTTAVMLMIVIYSIWYTGHMKGSAPVWFYTLLLGMEAGLLGCLYTGDVFNLFVMIEVLALSAYALVAFYRSRPQAVEAAVKYAMLGATATTIYFLSCVLIYASYGTLNMADVALKAKSFLVGGGSPGSGGFFGNVVVDTAAALALALWAFTFKAALFPNHFWLPDAHPEAPTPVSAALSGLVVNVGAYAVARFMYTLFGDGTVAAATGLREALLYALLVLGIASGLVGALLMIVQNDIKRLLAYSTISHMGLIFMGASIGLAASYEAQELGLTAMLYHTINHSVGKALLFLAAGIFIHAAGTRDMDKLSGVGRLYPIASASLILGFMQLLGLPPFGGFFSKLMLYQAFLDAGMPIAAAMVVVISAVSVLGYAKAIYAVVFSHPAQEFKKIRGLDAVGVLTLFMGVVCLLLGVLAPWVVPALEQCVGGSLMPRGVDMYVKAFLSAYHTLAR